MGLKASMIHYTPHLEKNDFISIDLDGVEGESSGIKLNMGTLRIVAIEESSQIAEHNRREPEMAICVGDRVIQVNGKTAEHVEDICNDLMKDGKHISLTVKRGRMRVLPSSSDSSDNGSDTSSGPERRGLQKKKKTLLRRTGSSTI